jgi:hypothetical protein
MYTSVGFSAVIIHLLSLRALIAYTDVDVDEFEGTDKTMSLKTSEEYLSNFSFRLDCSL